MKLSFTIIIATFLCLCIVYAEDQGDWVNSRDLPVMGSYPNFYAGYLNVDSKGEKKLFYVFHQSESNPSKDPLIVRVSPGPGCSSLYSWLYSKGPFVFLPGLEVPGKNQYNWNKEANVLFIEGPAGVGFSKYNGSVPYYSSDEQFSLEMVYALFAFYNKFPEYKDQELYLSGEQYAGIIIPMMAKLIVQKNNDRQTPSYEKIKLKGFLLENPCTLADECNDYTDFNHYTIQYLKNHYFISREKYNKYIHQCTMSKQSAQCHQELAGIENGFIKTGSDITNIYRQCIQQTGQEKYKCLDTKGIYNFMATDGVTIDLHVDQSIDKWELCNMNILKKFKRGDGSLHIYEQLLREQRDLRIWIVSGTLSAAVPTIGTRRWVESLKQSLQRNTIRMWDAWKFDGDINAGQIEEIRGLTFLTVRAAGSYIYRDQPEIGHHIITSFLKGKAL